MKANLFGILLTTLISVYAFTVSFYINEMDVPTIYSGNYPNGLVVTIDGTIITNADIQNPNGNGLVIHANNVLIDDVVVHNVKGHGILMEDHHDIVLKNSTVYNTVTGTCYPSCSGGWESAVKVRSSNETDKLAYNIFIENNVIYNNYGEGIGARGSLIVIRNNTIYDNFSVNIYSNSDNMLIDSNYVYCTNDSRFFRDGLPATGIAASQEYFAGWSGHAYKQTIVNNIVDGCKSGFVYNKSETGVTPTGFRDSVIIFNSFVNISHSSIRIDYEQGQSNVVVQNNIGVMSNVANFSGISYVGNVTQNSVTFISNSSGESKFHLQIDREAVGQYVAQFDIGGTLRATPLSVGAWEFK